ncbi:MAG: HAMP domain-containing protein [Burkholderiales bacterium]|nr:MAG: HAMP domain-containing protein [Burkholderiales bacterium]
MVALRNLRVGTRLALAFLVLLSLMVGMAALGVFQARMLNGYITYYPENILPSLRTLNQVQLQLSAARRYELRALLADAAGHRAQAEQVAKAKQVVLQRLKDYEVLVSDDTDRALMQKATAAAGAFFAVQDRVLRLAEQAGNDAAAMEEARQLSFDAGLKAFTAVTEGLAAWWDYNEKLAGDATESAAAAYVRVFVFSGLAAAVALAFGVAAGVFITRSITRPLQEAAQVVEAVAAGDLTQRTRWRSRDELGQLLLRLDGMSQSLSGTVAGVRQGCDQLNVAAAEIAQGNADLSGRTESQASSLEETAAAVEEMVAQIQANAESARQADQLAQRASGAAQAGGQAVGEIVLTMDAISASSRRIADIIGVIDGIAFQTNILALNAAVEAARAGEQGRGFAVVAGEVRVLAQRSAEAAKEIKSLIGESVSKVENGSAQVLSARGTIEQMVDEIKKVTDLVAEITTSSRQQAEGATQINEAVGQIDQTTQQNAALVEQTAAAAESLRNQTTKLVAAVAAFRVDTPSGGLARQ